VATPRELIVPTPQGLYCAEGPFHIDPWRPVGRAVVTHAHSDHATWGCGEYLCSGSGAGVLRERVGADAAITGLPYGESVTVGGVRVSLHPAGHILGSAQVRVERVSDGETWVVSGDYKTVADRTCGAFAPVRCHTFITESTFGLPIYRWADQASVFDDLNAWWRASRAQARTCVVLAYALGKAQRVLAGLDPSIGPIAVHGAVRRFNRAYAAAGVALPEAPGASDPAGPDVRGCGLVVAPPSALGSPWLRRFATGPAEGGVSAAMVSGWMQVRGTRRRRAVDRGFVLSDHADWPGLLEAIRATGATRVGVTHGSIGPMVRYLRELGLDAFEVPTRYVGETGEDQPGQEDDTTSDAPHEPGASATGRSPPEDGPAPPPDSPPPTPPPPIAPPHPPNRPWS
jgi:putative mRNA 3-end processing factor